MGSVATTMTAYLSSSARVWAAASAAASLTSLLTLLTIRISRRMFCRGSFALSVR